MSKGQQTSAGGWGFLGASWGLGPMRIYQFHFFDRSGRRPALDFADCHHDDEAARLAFRQLQQHASCEGVEVFEEDRLVMRLERSAPPPESARPGLHGV